MRLPLSILPVGTKDSVQRYIYIFTLVHDAVPEDSFLAETAFFHHPSTGRITYVVLCFQTVEGKGTKSSVNHSAQRLGGVAAIPICPGKAVTEFCGTVFFGIPDKTNRTDYDSGFPEYDNPGRGITGEGTPAEKTDKRVEVGLQSERYSKVDKHHYLEDFIKEDFLMLNLKLDMLL